MTDSTEEIRAEFDAIMRDDFAVDVSGSWNGERYTDSLDNGVWIGYQAAKRKYAARIAELESKIFKLRRFIDKEGYRRCDIPACNCCSFHGGHAQDRLNEIKDCLLDNDCKWRGTILATLEQALTGKEE